MAGSGFQPQSEEDELGEEPSGALEVSGEAVASCMGGIQFIPLHVNEKPFPEEC